MNANWTLMAALIIALIKILVTNVVVNLAMSCLKIKKLVKISMNVFNQEVVVRNVSIWKDLSNVYVTKDMYWILLTSLAVLQVYITFFLNCYLKNRIVWNIWTSIIFQTRISNFLCNKTETISFGVLIISRKLPVYIKNFSTCATTGICKPIWCSTDLY